MKAVTWMLPALLLAACSAGPVSRETPASYDFGAWRNDAAVTRSIKSGVLLHAVVAPAWLDSTAIVYRLNYQDVARPQNYANSRWVGVPAALLTQRLRASLGAASEGGVVSIADGVRADYALRLELDEFSQIFDAADRSRGVVVVRASLVNTAKRALVAQRSFTVERAAASADAEGGVRALAAAGGELVDAVVAWTAAGIAQERK
jgi:cholesterol transport system auxiliary component